MSFIVLCRIVDDHRIMSVVHCFSLRRRMRERRGGEEERVEREPTITSLCLALVRATFTLLQSHSRLPTFVGGRGRGEIIKVSIIGRERGIMPEWPWQK